MLSSMLLGLTGLMQGARHALEPDHITAVATVMVDSESSRRGVFYAFCWGAGHAAMLILVAGPLVILRLGLPEMVMKALELGTAAMLVYLGVHALRHRTRAVPHHHHGALHVRGRRPFVIGIAHGLAGSGALATLIALESPTVLGGMVALTLYALGTVFGMVGLALLVGPMLVQAGRLPRIAVVLSQVAGVASILVGFVWAARTLSG